MFWLLPLAVGDSENDKPHHVIQMYYGQERVRERERKRERVRDRKRKRERKKGRVNDVNI